MLVDPGGGGGVEPAPPANTTTEAKPLVSFDQDEGQTWTKKEKETIEDAANGAGMLLTTGIPTDTGTIILGTIGIRHGRT